MTRWRCNFCNDDDEPLDMSLTWETEDVGGYAEPGITCPKGHTFCGEECCGCWASEVEE